MPLLNFEGGPRVPFLNSEGGPGVPLLNFEGDPGFQVPRVLVTLLHHAGSKVREAAKMPWYMLQNLREM